MWPQDSAFRDASEFVRNWNVEPLYMPDIGIADDGEVNFAWDQRGIYLDLGFYGDGTYSYYGKSRDGKEFLEDDLAPSDGLTSELRRIING